MENHKSITFDKAAQDALPQHIKDLMQSQRNEAILKRKESSEMIKKVQNEALDKCVAETYKSIIDEKAIQKISKMVFDLFLPSRLERIIKKLSR